jgi:lysozyme
MTVTDGPKGIDVSSNNGPIQWHLVKESDVEFAYIRSGDGITPDARFRENVLAAQAQGILVGAYEYHRPRRR